MLSRHGDDPQEEEDKRLGDGAEHLDHLADGCAGTLGNILLYVVLHGQSAGHNPRKQHYATLGFCCLTLTHKASIILRSTHAMIEEMAKSSATR